MQNLASNIQNQVEQRIVIYLFHIIQRQKPTESDEQQLKEAVRENEFFKTRTDYPPEKEDESLVAYTLTITVGDNVHTTRWTDVSKEVPDGIIRTVNEIKGIISKEKIV